LGCLNQVKFLTPNILVNELLTLVWQDGIYEGICEGRNLQVSI
jgi:hypothetical protein